ncbi:LacI family DNA-binding transcriptional regulator [Neobacillus sp. Marseille-QA0830]
MKIDEIAKLANVSKSAVSLALNGKKGVSESTREKILKIAEANGYIPRPIIRAEPYPQTTSKILRFVAVTNVGIVTDQFQSLPFFTELINNIHNQIVSSGYSLLVSPLHAENLYEEISILEGEQKSAGILLLGTNLTPEEIKVIAEVQPNLVVVDTCFDTMNTNFVLMNNVYGAYQAAQHLMKMGHTEIGYVESNIRMYNFDKRKEGFFQALTENNVNIKETNYYSISPTSITSQEDFIEKMKDRNEPLPTALFCETDYMAISVMKSLSELGIQVPQDISVVGFDDIVESRVITPELTTVQVKKDKIASLGVEILIKQIENHDMDKIKVYVDTELIERNSCKDQHS